MGHCGPRTRGVWDIVGRGLGEYGHCGPRTRAVWDIVGRGLGEYGTLWAED